MAAAEKGAEASHVHAAHVLLAGALPSPSSRLSQPSAPQVLQRRVAQFPPHILARWMKVDCKGRVNVGLRLSSALSQIEADNRDMTARYQQLELRLTHAEAELDTLRRSEKDRSLQLQVLLAPVASGSFCCLTPLAPHLCAAGRAG